jgi:hypothetical protein
MTETKRDPLYVTCPYTKAAWDATVEGLTPEQLEQVKMWWNGKLPKGFYESCSRPAHDAIHTLISMGLG